MKRREFLRCLALGLAGGWALRHPNKKLRPDGATAGGPEMRLAFLADAYLKGADQGRPEALALARVPGIAGDPGQPRPRAGPRRLRLAAPGRRPGLPSVPTEYLASLSEGQTTPTPL